MSRKPLPTRIKRLRGTLRSDRAPANPFSTAPALTGDPVPKELADDPEAKKQWRRLVPVLVAARRASSVDRLALLSGRLSYRGWSMSRGGVVGAV